MECPVVPFSRASSWSRDWTGISCSFCIGRWILYHWATCEAFMFETGSHQRDFFVFCHCAAFHLFSYAFQSFCWNFNIIFRTAEADILWLELGMPFLVLGFPDGSVGKEPSCNVGDTGDAGSIPGSGRSPRIGNGYPLQYSCLGNPMERGALVGLQSSGSQSQTLLSDYELYCSRLLVWDLDSVFPELNRIWYLLLLWLL